MADVDYTNDIDVLRTWVGRTRSMTDTVSASVCSRFEATLGRSLVLSAGDPLPPLWHFLMHLESVPLHELGPDGHPRRGAFLPPVLLPRRMWAGGRLTFTGDILVGDEVVKTSTVDSVEMKTGRSGELCFVTVVHELSVGGEVRIREEQDLVYKDDAAPHAVRPVPKPAPTEADFMRLVAPSEAMLFRYSALTFNAHRIHYDLDYARTVEGYSNLVFHGPLTATLLADLVVVETGQQLASFSFRGLAPLFGNEPFAISGTRDGNRVSLWAATPSGGLAMSAVATLRSV